MSAVEQALGSLVRGLRANPQRFAVLLCAVEGADEPDWEPGAPRTLWSKVQAEVQERLGPELEQLLEEGASRAATLGRFLHLVAPTPRARKELCAAVLAGEDATPGERALAALCVSEHLRAVLVSSGQAHLRTILEQNRQVPRHVDLNDADTAAAAAKVRARWPEIAELDPPWLRPGGDPKPGIARVVAWLKRVQAEGVIVVGHEGQKDLLLSAVAEAAGGLPLGVVWIGTGSGAGRAAVEKALANDQPFLDIPTRTPSAALEQLRAKLEAPLLPTVRLPFLQRVLDTPLEPRLIARRVPLVSGYLEELERLPRWFPTVTLRSLLLAVLLGLVVLGSANAYVGLAFRGELIEARQELEQALKEADEDARSDSGSKPGAELIAEGRARARERTVSRVRDELRDPELIPQQFFVPGFVRAQFTAKARALADEAQKLDDERFDLDLFRHGLRARVRFDRLYGKFGRFAEPSLARIGDPPVWFSMPRVLEHQHAVVVAPRDLLVEVLLLRGAVGLVSGRDQLPVLVSLRGYDGGDLIDLVHTEMTRTGGVEEGDLSRKVLIERLESGRIVLFFANVEGARRVERAIHRIRGLVASFPGAPVLLGMHDARFARDLPGFSFFSVLPFTSQAVLAWLDREQRGGLAAALRERPRLLEAARDPLALSMVISYYESTGELPPSMVKLLDVFVDGYLTQVRHAEKQGSKSRPAIGRLAFKTLFAELGGALTHVKGNQIRRDLAIEMMARAVKQVPETGHPDPVAIPKFGAPTAGDYATAEEYLDRMLETGILVPTRGDAVTFADPLLLTYFQQRIEYAHALRGMMYNPDPLQRGTVLGLTDDPFRFQEAHKAYVPETPGAQGLYLSSQPMGRPIPPGALLTVAGALGSGPSLDPVYEALLVERLVAYLVSPYRAMTNDAQQGLLQFDRPGATLRLIRELRRGSHSDEVWSRVLETVVAIGHPAAVDPLLVLAEGAPLERRGRLLRATAAHATPAAVAAVLRAVDGESPFAEPSLRADAVAALSELLRLDAQVPWSEIERRLRADPERFGALVQHLPRIGSEPAFALSLAYLAGEGSPDPWRGAGDPGSDLERAASAITGFGPGVRPRLLQALQARPQAAWLALGMGGFRDPATVPAIVASARACASAEPNASLTVALRGLLRVGPPGEAALIALDQEIDLGRALGARDPSLARPFVTALSEVDSGVDLLERWLESASTNDMRLVLLEGLIRAKSQLADGALLRLLDDPDASVRQRARALLVECPSTEVRLALHARALTGAGDSWGVLRTVAAVWDDDLDLTPISDAIRSREPELQEQRLALAMALGRSGQRAFFPLLREQLDSDREDAWRFATALGELGDTRAPHALITAISRLDSPRLPPRTLESLLRAAARSLEGDPGQQDLTRRRQDLPFSQLFGHPDREVRDAANELFLGLVGMKKDAGSRR